MKLMIATDKGLIQYNKLGSSWGFSDLFFDGLPVSCFHVDVEGHWWVSCRHLHWGVKIYRSVNQGNEFQEITAPKFSTAKTLLKNVWEIQSRILNGRKQVFIGTEPAGLFISENNGTSFHAIEGLENHPSRSHWRGGGKGSINPFLHTLLIHPKRPDEWLIGISCAGVFVTYDAGTTWKSQNKGISSPFLPDAVADVGHDPHCIKRHPKQADLLWQQNHCGIYLSYDNGEYWQSVSDKVNELSYGFALEIEEAHPGNAWVIPVAADDHRVPLNHRLSVYHTQDFGNRWEKITQGLPDSLAFDVVLRKGMVKKGLDMAFGTNHGNVYVSEDAGQSWQNLSHHLSKVTALYFID